MGTGSEASIVDAKLVTNVFFKSTQVSVVGVYSKSPMRTGTMFALTTVARTTIFPVTGSATIEAYDGVNRRQFVDTPSILQGTFALRVTVPSGAICQIAMPSDATITR